MGGVTWSPGEAEKIREIPKKKKKKKKKEKHRDKEKEKKRGREKTRGENKQYLYNPSQYNPAEILGIIMVIPTRHNDPKTIPKIFN